MTAFMHDDNYVPITTLGLSASKAITYVAGAGNSGVQGATTLFTVTGTVAVYLFAVCSKTLTSSGGATIKAGIAGNTTGLIASTGYGSITNALIWKDASPATLIAFPSLNIITGTDIIQTIATADISDGTLTYYCVYVPLSSGASVVAA